MEVTHTLDFSRLRTLESIKLSLAGSLKRLTEEMSKIAVERDALVRKLENASSHAAGGRIQRDKASDGHRIYNPSTQEDRGSLQPDMDENIRKSWAKISKELQAEFDEMNARQKTIQAELDDIREQFNEAAWLFENCKRFVDRVTAGGIND